VQADKADLVGISERLLRPGRRLGVGQQDDNVEARFLLLHPMHDLGIIERYAAGKILSETFR
jgi:hypothetical protein